MWQNILIRRLFSFFLGLTVAVAFCGLQKAFGYASGHENDPPEIQAWFARQKQPDLPTTSCCGDYDAYWADEFEQKDGKFYAIITEGKNNIPAGTRVEIPPKKFPKENGDPNPSGHGVVFMSLTRGTDNIAHPGQVYCYFYPILN